MWVAHWANVVANLVEVHGVESCGGSVVAQQTTEVAYSGPGFKSICDPQVLQGQCLKRRLLRPKKLTGT